MKAKEWKELLTNLTHSESFLKSINDEGFYLSPKYKTFREYTQSEWGVTSTVNTESLLSLDFWSEQSPVLTKNGYYLIRTGRGSFAIFQENKFPRPYLDLKVENTQTLEPSEPQGYEDLKSSFKENILENSALEQLRFNKTLEKIVLDITGEHEFVIGPRGNTTSSFELYLKRNDGDIVKIKQYVGFAELDYTVWTKNSVLLFEAKKSDNEPLLDIGWHKIAFPAVRFQEYKNLKIYPIYFLRLRDKLLVFIFPQFSFHNKGIILNDKHQMTPEKTYEIPI